MYCRTYSLKQDFARLLNASVKLRRALCALIKSFSLWPMQLASGVSIEAFLGGFLTEEGLAILLRVPAEQARSQSPSTHRHQPFVPASAAAAPGSPSVTRR